jgi:Flp pilus assembly protein TadB
VDSPGTNPQPEGETQPAQDTAQAAGTGRLLRYLAVYTVLRLGLVVVLTAVLAFFMPLIVALMFAIIVQLPLAWWLFSGPRSRVNDAIAVSTARRRAERERLQAALSGDSPALNEPPTAPS